MPIGAIKNSWAINQTGEKRLAYSQNNQTFDLYIGGGIGQFEHGLGLTGFRYTYKKINTDRWTDIACGYAWTIAVNNDGTLWSWGVGYPDPVADGFAANALGLGNDQRVNVPTQVGTADNWSKVFADQYRSFGIKTDGTLWSWGFSYYSGSLGLGGSNSSASVPTQIGTANNWTDLDSEGEFSSVVLAINSSGELWGWGDNNNGNCGRLGIGNDTNDYYAPIQLTGSTGWTDIAVGTRHSLAIKNGVVYGAGCNTNYELGVGDTTKRTSWTEITGPSFSEVAISGYTSYVIRNDGTLWGWGDGSQRTLNYPTSDLSDEPYPIQIGTDSDWDTFVDSHSSYGMYGIIIKKTNGTMFAMLGNSQGAVNISLNQQDPVSGELYIESNGYRTGDSNGLNNPVGGSTAFSENLSKVAIGRHHGAIIKNDHLWTVGRNDRSQLGNGVDGIRIDQKFAGQKFKKILNYYDTSSPSGNLFITKEDGTLWGMGQAALGNNFSSFGDDTGGTLATTTNKVLYREPTQISTETFWNDILSFTTYSFYYSAFIKSDGTFWFTGSASINPGTNANTDVWTQYGTDTHWSQVTSFESSTFLIKNDGTLWAYGENSYGELGLGDTTDRYYSGLTQVGTADNWSKVSSGQRYTLGLRTDGTIWSTGWGQYGRLGHGDTLNKTVFTQIGTADNWTDISANYDSSTALNSNGEIYGWGPYTITKSLNNSGNYSPRKLGTDTDWAGIINSHRYAGVYAVKSDNSLWVIYGASPQDGDTFPFGEDWSDGTSLPKEVTRIGTVSTDEGRIGIIGNSIGVLK